MRKVLGGCAAGWRKIPLAVPLLAQVTFAIFPVTGQSIADAQAKQASGDWLGAAQTWKQLADATPQDYRLWTSQGIALAHEGRFAEAVTAYQKAKAIAPQDPQTNFNLGLAYFKTNRLEEAIAPLKTAGTVLPDPPQVWLLLGMCLYGTGGYQQAAAALEKARAAGQVENAEFKQVLAQCYLRTKQYDAAKTELTDLLRANPNSASTYMFLGEAEDASGHSDRAKEDFRAAITADGRLPDLHFGLGYLWWKDRAYAQAESEFRKELELDSNHERALSYLGDVQLKQGEKQQAAATLKRAAAVGRPDWLTQLNLGILASGSKDWMNAKTHLQRAAELAPQRAEPHYRLAQVYKAAGESAKAAAELRIVSAMHQQQEDDLVEKISGSKAPQTNSRP